VSIYPWEGEFHPDPALCPPEIVESFMRYIEEGVPLGDFLEAVVRDKLIDSFGRADQTNIRLMPHIAAWVYQFMPISARQYDQWLKMHAELREQNRKETSVQHPTETGDRGSGPEDPQSNEPSGTSPAGGDPV
jgi:hypothetical protein